MGERIGDNNYESVGKKMGRIRDRKDGKCH